MRVTNDSKSSTSVSLNIKADSADLEPIKRHVLGHFVKQTKVPGFRAGKAPLHMVETHANQRQLADEFLEHAINELFQKAVVQEKLRPVGRPNVKLKKFVPYSALEFDVEVESLGKIELANYKKIKIDKPKVTVTADEIKEVLESLAKRSAERKEVERAAKSGDEVLIDFSGADENGQKVSGAEGKDYPLLLGSGSFIPGFEDKLIGLKAGENKEFEVTFPSDYGVAALRAKKVTFSVTVTKVNELEVPKIDDKFAAKVGPFKSLPELKADIKKQLLAEKQQQVDRAYESKLIAEISEQSKVEIPESMVEDQLMRMEDEEKRNLAYRGQTWQEHLAEERVTEEEHRTRQRPDAAARVKAGLVLSEIAGQENLDVTTQEIDAQINSLKSQHTDPVMQAELDKPANRQEIASRLLTEKTINKLVEYAS